MIIFFLQMGTSIAKGRDNQSIWRSRMDANVFRSIERVCHYMRYLQNDEQPPHFQKQKGKIQGRQKFLTFPRLQRALSKSGFGMFLRLVSNIAMKSLAE